VVVMLHRGGGVMILWMMTMGDDGVGGDDDRGDDDRGDSNIDDDNDDETIY